jgi:hypothetical protein
LAFESESFVEFQQVEQQFFADAVRDGKTKLVIDLSANGGGYILQGYDLFRQLFPNIVQDGYTRWRESDTFLTIADIYSANSANFNPSAASVEAIQQYEATFNYRYDLNLTDQPFLTFADKFAPHVYKGDNFTNLMRWNLSDPFTTSNPDYGVGTDITGYNSRTNFTQPFKAENIILVSQPARPDYSFSKETLASGWVLCFYLHSFHRVYAHPGRCEIDCNGRSPNTWSDSRSRRYQRC